MPVTESRRLDESSDSSSNAVQNGCSLKFKWYGCGSGGSGRRRMLYDVKEEEGGVDEAGQYSDRPGQQDCMNYLRTVSCGYGTNCKYNHPNYVSKEAIYGSEGNYLKEMGCLIVWSSCKYNHPKDKSGASPVSLSILGLPVRPEEVPCKYYLRTGQCKFGPACKFHHPQPTVPGSVFPVNGNMHFRSAESSHLPVRAFPALPMTMPMPAPTYIYDSRMHSPQAFMPIAVSPPQGYFPQQAWNTLSGNFSQVSFTSAYGSSHSSGSNSNGQVQYLPLLTHYPERPDRHECRYFSNNGSCKYGSYCKFNHPKERNDQLPSQPSIPLACLEQTLCSSFITYGVCRSGPACRFRHQGMGYPMNYGLIPILLPTPIFNESLFGRKSSNVVISSETSSPQLYT